MSGPQTFSPLPQTITSEIIAEQVRTRIADGTFEQGQTIGEAVIASEFGVSRGPVREALGRLVQEDLLVKERGRKLRVPTLNMDDIRDIYRTRTALETSALIAIIEQGAQQFISEAKHQLLILSEATKANDPDTATAADLAFHQLIIDSSGSPRLSRAFAALRVETQMCLSALNELDPHQSGSIELHSAIISAVETCDASTVLGAVEKHNNAMLGIFEQAFDEKTLADKSP